MLYEIHKLESDILEINRGVSSNIYELVKIYRMSLLASKLECI